MSLSFGYVYNVYDYYDSLINHIVPSYLVVVQHLQVYKGFFYCNNIKAI